MVVWAPGAVDGAPQPGAVKQTHIEPRRGAVAFGGKWMTSPVGAVAVHRRHVGQTPPLVVRFHRAGAAWEHKHSCSLFTTTTTESTLTEFTGAFVVTSGDGGEGGRPVGSWGRSCRQLVSWGLFLVSFAVNKRLLVKVFKQVNISVGRPIPAAVEHAAVGASGRRGAGSGQSGSLQERVSADGLKGDLLEAVSFCNNSQR